MKKLLYLSLVLPLFLFSCKSIPEAHFHTDTVTPEVGKDVFFTNDSHNASRFKWDFGDGIISNDENPVHYYSGTGPFEVTLTAISKSGLEDQAKLSLNVVIPTLLEIEVREYYQEYVVPDASVILYSSITDWDAQTNKISEGLADAGGIVVFSNLDPYVYYVDVWEKTHDNYTLRNEDVGFVRTPEILPNQINRFIAWVDIANHGKGTRNLLIKKFERKSTNKRQPGADEGTEGWQELYAKSIHKKK
ncbi:MAG: PKD domain-containing protein [Bacteroidetes bacterium]|nr:MAG: PKD domain-containing protein [Bacteroidota bacterium]